MTVGGGRERNERIKERERWTHENVIYERKEEGKPKKKQRMERGKERRTDSQGVILVIETKRQTVEKTQNREICG